MNREKEGEKRRRREGWGRDGERKNGWEDAEEVEERGRNGCRNDSR